MDTQRHAGEVFGFWDVDVVGPTTLTPELSTEVRDVTAETALEVHLRAAFRPRAPEVWTTGTGYGTSPRW